MYSTQCIVVTFSISITCFMERQSKKHYVKIINNTFLLINVYFSTSTRLDYEENKLLFKNL